jgi:hypothetical protein
MQGQVQVGLLLYQLSANHKRGALQNFDKEAVRAKLHNNLKQSITQSLQNDKATLTPPAAYLPNRRTVAPPSGAFSWFGLHQMTMRVAVLALLFVMVGAIFAWAIQASAPGDWLYGAKVSLEQAGSSFGRSPENKAAALFNYASHRLEEIEQAVEQHRFDSIDLAVLTYNGAIDEAIAASKNASTDWLRQQLVPQQNRLLVLQQATNLPAKTLNQITDLINHNQAILQKLLAAATPTAPPSGK